MTGINMCPFLCRLQRLLALIICLYSFSLHAQTTIAPTPANERLNAYDARLELKENSLVKNVRFRSAGPSVMSGRAVDIAANPDNPAEFFVAYASGGLWHTVNNGQSFGPLFDNQPVMTIGDIAVDWKHGKTIYVGTGENNSSRSSYSGTGIYKSTDHGKTWRHLGLPESHHIGRIIIHPENPDIIWVAVQGHLYSANPERGIYKTTNGGKFWQKTLFINDSTGAIDLVTDPTNPDILYAAMWERSRRAWNFTESGQSSGIYKSIDGGVSWQLLSTEESGFPTGEGVGRTGLAVYPQNPQIIYAFLDNQNRREEKDEDKPAITKDLLRQISKKEFLKLDGGDVNDFLDRLHFPLKFNADTIFRLIRNDIIDPVTLVNYLEDANAELFDTPVIGGEVYRSTDGGQSWQRTHEDYLDNLVYSFGYYFGEIRVSSFDANKIYLLAVPILKSADGGKTFSSINQENVHVDHHAMWINPGDPAHHIIGNDGGINITYDDGATWKKANQTPVGQFYTVAVDMAEPYNVYGGLQDNGVWVGPGTYKASKRWQGSGHYPYEPLIGGDGMQIAIDTRDNNTVYTGSQFGYYQRIDRQSGKSESIKPRHELNERPYRFNWQTPIHLSVHNLDILYLGSHLLHRSMDGGRNWEAISGDLTTGGKKGDVPYGTLTSIHESPLKFGLIYTGSDDGLIHVTRDGGHRWTGISDSLPQNFWISRVQASTHHEGRVFASLNGYRRDNFDALLFRSENYGQSWRRIGLDLPAEPVNVVREDPVNENILYASTDHGLYLSIDGGESFMAFSKGLPDAPVHDLVIHPRENDLVVGTHGRSIYIADVQHVQQLKQDVIAEKLHIFKLPDITYSKYWGSRRYDWKFSEAPGLNCVFYVSQDAQAKVRIKFQDQIIGDYAPDADRGLNYFDYHLTVDDAYLKKYKSILKESGFEKDDLKSADNGKFYLRAGKYTLEIEANGETQSITFEIKQPEKRERKAAKKTP